MDVKEYNKRYYEKHKEKLIQHNKEYWAAKAKAYRVPDLEGEEWLPLVGFEEHYMASNMGRIKSLWRMKERIIDGSYDKDGYKKITLTYPDPHIPSIWEFNRTRMELALKIRNEKDYV